MFDDVVLFEAWERVAFGGKRQLRPDGPPENACETVLKVFASDGGPMRRVADVAQEAGLSLATVEHKIYAYKDCIRRCKDGYYQITPLGVEVVRWLTDGPPFAKEYEQGKVAVDELASRYRLSPATMYRRLVRARDNMRTPSASRTCPT